MPMPNAGSPTQSHRVLVAGGCVVAPSASADAGYRKIALDPQELLGPERGRRLDPMSQWAIVAAERAREHAQLPRRNEPDKFPSEGLALGTALGASSTGVRYATRLVTAGPAATNPIDFPDSIDGAPAAHVAIELGLCGPSLTFVDGFASARSALSYAARQIAWGRATRMHVIAGDRFATILGEAMARDPSFCQDLGSSYVGVSALAAEVVVALVLEPMGQREPPKHALELVFTSGGQTPERSPAAASTDIPGWYLGSDGAVHLGSSVPAGCHPLRDPSGALELAAAWLLAVGTGAHLVGLPDPGLTPARVPPMLPGQRDLALLNLRGQ
jgi:hypothetical protein